MNCVLNFGEVGDANTGNVTFQQSDLDVTALQNLADVKIPDQLLIMNEDTVNNLDPPSLLPLIDSLCILVENCLQMTMHQAMEFANGENFIIPDRRVDGRVHEGYGAVQQRSPPLE